MERPRPRIALVGTYTPRNHGDAALVNAALETIAKAWPAAVVDLVTPYPEEYVDHLARQPVQGVSVVVRPSRLKYHPRRPRILRYASAFAFRVRDLWRGNWPHGRRPEVCLFMAGGNLFSSRKGPFGLGSLAPLMALRSAQRAGIPTGTLPVSLGPYHFWVDKWLAVQTLRRTRVVMARERGSHAWAVAQGLPAELVPDLALGLRWRRARPDPDRIGLVVMDWRFAATGRADEAQAEYEDRLVELGRLLLADPEVRLTVYPQVVAGPFDDDRPPCQRVAARLGPERVTVHEFPATASPQDVVAEYGRNQAMLCSRLHAAIFSLTAGRPVVVLGYQPKAAGTMELLGMPADVFPIGAFDPMKVASRLLDLRHDPPAIVLPPVLDQAAHALREAFPELRGKASG